MRIVSWNIRAGGGSRGRQIAEQLRRWRPDIVALSEFRGTPASRSLAAGLSDDGLLYHRSTVDPARPASNALLVASRWPLRPLRRRGAPDEPGRWLLVGVPALEPFSLAALHVPNRVSGRKYTFLDATLRIARGWRGGPALMIGDTNSGRIGLDEEAPAFTAREDGWICALEAAGWLDAFRHQHADVREYTWYSPNGRNGFRLDQAFVNRRLLPRLRDARYLWGGEGATRRDALSDHAALIIDFDL